MFDNDSKHDLSVLTERGESIELAFPSPAMPARARGLAAAPPEVGNALGPEGLARSTWLDPSASPKTQRVLSVIKTRPPPRRTSSPMPPALIKLLCARDTDGCLKSGAEKTSSLDADEYRERTGRIDPMR